jgi:hypothetical protein
MIYSYEMYGGLFTHKTDDDSIPVVRPGENAPDCAFVFEPREGARFDVPARVLLAKDHGPGARADYLLMMRARRDAVDQCRKFGLRASSEL